MTITLTREEAQQVLDALGSCDTDYVFDGEDERPVDSYDEEKVGTAYRLLRARLAQPEPEPVAWAWGVNSGAGYYTKGVGFDKTDIPFAKHTPLYTAPPQREWQGLTDEEAEQITDAHWNDPAMFIEAIEAKLKQKNA